MPRRIALVILTATLVATLGAKPDKPPKEHGNGPPPHANAPFAVAPTPVPVPTISPIPPISPPGQPDPAPTPPVQLLPDTATH